MLPDDTFLDTGSQESLLTKSSSPSRLQNYEKIKDPATSNKIESSKDEELVSKKRKFKFDRKLFLKGQGSRNHSSEDLPIKKAMLNDFKLQNYPDNDGSD